MQALSWNTMWQMAAPFLFVVTSFVSEVFAITGEMALLNVTRKSSGDIFTLSGSDCGLTRCMEFSHGTALSALETGSCSCKCRDDLPAYREDQRMCVSTINEYAMAKFGKGTTKPSIPFTFLPLKGQILYPAKEIIFTELNGATCAVTSAQYLSPSGWVTLRDSADNDVPFSVYRDEGSTFLQWRGSPALHSRLEGRLIAVHVLCSGHSANQQLATSCAAFRIAGVSSNGLFDVRSIPFHAGELIHTDGTNQGLSIIESVAIGVCVLMLVFVYAAGIIFYVHYKQRLKRGEKDPEINLTNTLSTENGSTLGSRMDMDSLRLKTNPLLKMDNLENDFLIDAALSDVSERTEETLDMPFYGKSKQSANLVSAIVHSRQKKPPRLKNRPQSRSPTTPERMFERSWRSGSPDGLEVAPHSDLSIVTCSVENNAVASKPATSLNGEPVIRRKLFFNPIFFETELLRNPPPAAIDFLVKIREVMAVAKEKMTSKRFIPNLSDIPEEESYHTIDLGWEIPCARQGRRFSAISLKRENSRRALHCGGCPGCDNSFLQQKNTNLARSNSCKVCVSDDYKQNIVRRWLDEVPSPQPARIQKSIAKVSGTPRLNSARSVTEIKINCIEDDSSQSPRRHFVSPSLTEMSAEKGSIQVNSAKAEAEIINEKKPTKRRVKKKLPAPPPPETIECEDKLEEEESIPIEVKVKMEAVIQELNKCRRPEPIPGKKPPKLVIPVTTVESEPTLYGNITFNARANELVNQDKQTYFDSLERNVCKRSRSMSGKSDVGLKNQQESNQQTIKCNEPFFWRTKGAADGCPTEYFECQYGPRSLPLTEVFIKASEPFYNNVPKPGPLTIEVKGTPLEDNQNINEDFDPDTLDRKPKSQTKKRVDKILLKSGGSFKHRTAAMEENSQNNNNFEVFTRKIGSLRQIYEAKARATDGDTKGSFAIKRGSLPYSSYDSAMYIKHSKAPDLIQQIEVENAKPPPLPPKQRRMSETPSQDSPMSERRRLSEERDRFPPKVENLSLRRSERRSNKTRTKRTDATKLSKTEDSGYLSTDSNESKRRASYYLHLKPKNGLPDTVSSSIVTNVPIESDTDDMESLCDGHSESGAESVETDSVFFGNVEDTTNVFREMTHSNADIQAQEQIDSGFAGETNIVLSGDSDSEHKSVISIIAGQDGRGSASSRDNCDEQLITSVD